MGVRSFVISRKQGAAFMCEGLYARGCFSASVYYGAPQFGEGRSFREAVASEEAKITILKRSGQVRGSG